MLWWVDLRWKASEMRPLKWSSFWGCAAAQRGGLWGGGTNISYFKNWWPCMAEISDKDIPRHQYIWLYHVIIINHNSIDSIVQLLLWTVSHALGADARFILFFPASPWIGLLTFLFLQLSNLAINMAPARRAIPWRAGLEAQVETLRLCYHLCFSNQEVREGVTVQGVQ